MKIGILFEGTPKKPGGFYQSLQSIILLNEIESKNFSFENINEDLLKLGLVKEFSEKDLCCHSYNLKTYNIKRDWNNPKGWANPENFNKYRW